MSEEKAVKLGVQALLEVVDSGAKNMEICIVRRGAKGGEKFMMKESDIDKIVKEIEAEIEEGKKGTSASSSAE